MTNVVFNDLNDVRLTVVVLFYDLRVIVDHHFFKFIFIMQLLYHIIRRCMLVFDLIFEENVVHIIDEGERKRFISKTNTKYSSLKIVQVKR